MRCPVLEGETHGGNGNSRSLAALRDDNALLYVAMRCEMGVEGEADTALQGSGNAQARVPVLRRRDAELKRDDMTTLSYRSG
jgi:hypothetical protein